MNSIKKYIAVGILALIAGIAGGYLLFSDQQSGEQPPIESMEDQDEGQIWTCSMHPQIRQEEPGLCPICEMDLIPLDQTVSDDPLVLQMTPEAVKLAQIQTTAVGSSDHELEALRLTGKIREDERLIATQAVHVPGRIEELFVTFTGERVTRGQKLATVYSPELVTAQRELIEALSFQSVNPDLVEATRKKLRAWKISDEMISEIESSGNIQENFPVFSDASGYVTRRRVSVGDYVQQGQALFEIVSYERLWVLFDAYEEDLPKIGVGDRLRFTTPSVPGRTFVTRVTYIDPAIHPQTRTASVRTEVDNGSGLLKPQMLVTGTLQMHTASDKIYVPKSAVLWTGPRSVVYVKKPEEAIPTFEYREIELGEGTDQHYAVLNGLASGEEVVTHGNFAIDAAAQLNNQQSMMNKLVRVKGDESQGPMFTEVTGQFRQMLDGVVQAYVGLKDALVASDPTSAKEAVTELLESLEKVNMNLVTGDAHDFWMQRESALNDHARQIQSSSDLEEQREQFGFLSDVLIQTIKAFGTSGTTYYVQYCPMAFDNTGADWISSQEQIRNPYFGDQMLKCGKVTDTLNAEMSPARSKRQQVHQH